jgi:CPA1 family monovalent cation:H+ antiporter
MRGVVSLAAALSIPVVLDNGAAFPHRDLILFVTFVAILLTLLVQGLTLPYFIRRSKLFNELIQVETEEKTKKKVKQELKQHIFEFLQNKYQHEWQGNAGMEKFIKQWEERAQATDDSWMNEKTKVIFLELLESQRQFLTELNKDPSIDEEIIRTQLYQIDLEEERLKIV